MFFAFLLALIAIGAGYYIHQQFSPAPATPEVSIPEGSKRGNVAASKRDIPSVDNTAANEAPLQSVIGGTKALEIGDKSVAEQPQRDDESSRDVKTAHSPTQAEKAAADAAPAVADANNNTVQLVKDSEGGFGGAADPASQSPTSKTAIIPTESERFRGELGNLPDSTARNSSPVPAASNIEVKPDPATSSALSEKKKKRSSGGKKLKISKKSKEIKSADGGASN